MRSNAFERLDELSRLVERERNIHRRYRNFLRNNPEPNKRNHKAWSNWYGRGYAIYAPADDVRKAIKHVALGFLTAWGVPSAGSRHANTNRARQVHDLVRVLMNKNTRIGQLRNRNTNAWRLIVELALRTKFPN